MNCQEFQSIVHDLANNRPMETPTRLSGLAHAKMCRGCGARLEEEQNLLAGFRAVVANDAKKEAAPRVESELRKAFLRQRNISLQHSMVSSPTLAWHWRRRALAMCALAAALTLVAWIWPRTPISRHAEPTGSVVSVPGAVHEDSSRPAVTAVQPVSKAGARWAARSKVSRTRPLSRHNSVAHRARRAVDDSQTVADLSETETATDFLPLLLVDAANEFERGQVVRVELPRSALISFGLPMNEERSREPIKADVLLGEDGLARAVRFIQ